MITWLSVADIKKNIYILDTKNEKRRVPYLEKVLKNHFLLIVLC